MSRLFCAVLVLVTFSVHAQFSAPPVIISEGTESHAAAPTHFEFGMYFFAKEATIAESMDAVSRSVNLFEKEIEKEELGATEITKTTPALQDIHSTRVSVYVSLRFDVRILPDEEDRLGSFGALCDEVLALSKQFNAVATGPIFDVDDKKFHEREAVQRATESALYRAEAVAELMQSQIYEVESVKVDSVEWIQESDDPHKRATLDRMLCDVRVTVSYRHQP